MLGSWEKGAENSNQNENLDSSEYQNLILESPRLILSHRVMMHLHFPHLCNGGGWARAVAEGLCSGFQGFPIYWEVHLSMVGSLV